MNIFYIILLTLLIYSLIATIVFVVTKENENVAIAFGLGIVGLSIIGLCIVYKKFKYMFKYRIGKRAIFEETLTGKKYKCKIKDTNDIEWMRNYKLVKRYAPKSEHKDIPEFSKAFIENSKKNCDNCKYDSECICEWPYNKIKCKNDCGTVIEFDKFKKK